jgi:serine protease AprX
MKGILLFCFSLLFFIELSAQQQGAKYWVQFTDKLNSPYSISSPENFLSSKCIDRRERLSIGFDERDIPVNQSYIEEVLATGQCTLHNKSKWFNAITVTITDSTLIDDIEALPFVSKVKSARKLVKKEIDSIKKLELDNQKSLAAALPACKEYPQYGIGFRQIEMLNGHLLHALRFTGKGVDIAQFDAGWNMTDKLPVFEKLRSEGRIKLVKDYVFLDDNTIYAYSNHGTFVLSTMAAWWPDSLIGTAPDANYFLFRTEDPLSESRVEEDNWVAAAEYCDSLGIDIINSSLGYSLFDDSSTDYSYEDMDGNTTRCTIAADIAAEKGILVINSAGNSGDNAWRFLTAPSDGDEVMCVGAVDADEVHASFSGYGPSADGDIKPNIVAMGKATAYADLDSTVSTGNGTSFSAPVMSGMAACLFQAFPEKSNKEIFDAIQQSASLYLNPNDSLGHGIPDMMQALTILQHSGDNLLGDFSALVYPNPCRDELSVIIHNSKACDIQWEIYDASGKRVVEGKEALGESPYGVINLSQGFNKLSSGLYTLHLGRAGRHSVIHFEKIKP